MLANRILKRCLKWFLRENLMRFLMGVFKFCYWTNTSEAIWPFQGEKSCFIGKKTHKNCIFYLILENQIMETFFCYI